MKQFSHFHNKILRAGLTNVINIKTLSLINILINW